MAVDRRRLGLRLMIWARNVGLARKLAFGLTLAVVPSVVATFLALTVSGPIGPDPKTVLSLIALDVMLLVALAVVIGVRIIGVWRARRRGSSGSRLHLRFIVLFALVAVTPAIVVSVGSTVFFRYGVESWFSDRVRTALQASLQVARAYLEEHQQIIGGDVLAMANDINREGLLLSRNPQRFSSFISSQAALRGLTEAVVFDGQGRVLARTGLAFSIESSLDQIPFWALEKARSGEVAVLTTEDDDRVRALVQLQGFFDETFLYVGRFVDPKVIGHMEQTSAAVAEYEHLEGRRLSLERAFSMIFAIIALLLLLAAVWVGLSMAMSLATPIVRLIDAAERVRSGDLTARVAEGKGADEIGSLVRAFNRMTEQLSEQRQELIDANRELDERSRFTETVLAGVSAGVVGLDRDGNIHLPNRSACDLLAAPPEALIGQHLTEIAPEFSTAFEEVVRRPEKLIQHEIKLVRQARQRTLLVRLAAERLEGETIGYVVTFDDISELVSAQRTAAWADVARRIAHEIKNPLTPIQLSAERLKRKYLKEIQSDPETYATLVDTIVRQVGDIGRMVDEFSSFARMPAPQMKKADLAAICREALFLQKTGNPGVRFTSAIPDHPVPMLCDSRLFGQALTNLLKNAVEAIQGRDGTDLPPGQVSLALFSDKSRITIEVSDNGKGLPKENRDRLTEPYVTTRTKGTGLGLAIVKKIVEDHEGDLRLEDAPSGGARVCLVFREGDDSSQVPAAEMTAQHGS
ncbi:sensor histidine kinase NtrY-like [Magnetospirillum gryphiswaldense]|uniref:Nitrogen regulation protein n=1 Tax=Magnetospirillum gryphiswaldense TaxID=55518 RepID=A4TZK4_9PROT|nr:PAS domain-containing sensor histidine kinase [Magnetospirillum gryphiswaldense]AVM73610.1 Sensor protein kinase WalK [Magnetospirillum gryphiswaldense MSR-1]AVM77513.1 Sensor protein kinase WalK [Magnetospirillum gryphiswaldense]CAM76061.1 Nitrogen regulation protein, NtrY, Signal transduction histidine kinase [Magnetospirillum gryphiswaldense MSR-1]